MWVWSMSEIRKHVINATLLHGQWRKVNIVRQLTFRQINPQDHTHYFYHPCVSFWGLISHTLTIQPWHLWLPGPYLYISIQLLSIVLVLVISWDDYCVCILVRITQSASDLHQRQLLSYSRVLLPLLIPQRVKLLWPSKPLIAPWMWSPTRLYIHIHQGPFPSNIDN